MNRVRKHLTFANIVASLALFIALGGASYAAVKLPAHSVGTAQLQNGAVTLPKISSGARDSLRGNDGVQGAIGPIGLTGAKGATGETGAKGATGIAGGKGATGEQGDPGASEGYFDRDSTTISASQAGSTVAATTLDAGNYLVSVRMQIYSGYYAPLRCALKNPAGQEIDDASIHLQPGYLQTGNSLALSASLSLEGQGQVSVKCTDADINDQNNVLQLSFVTNVSATQVSTLHAAD
jgi:hypothetical protein